jgi:hypothetical protein
VDEGHGPDRKKELLRILDDAERAASSVKSKGHDLVESATYSEGLVQHLRPVLQDLPDDSALPAETWEDLIDAWEGHAVQLGSVFKVMHSAEPLFFATGAAASLTTTTSSIAFSSYVIKPSPSLDALNSYLVRPSLLDEVRGALRRLELDRIRPGTRSPLSLLDEAADAIARPSASPPSPASVLLPIREAILATVASLLQRRPEQERAPKAADKILSIGRQCGLDGLDTAHFERLGRALTSLLERLSGAKQSPLTRTDVNREFDSALKFLKAFLTSLSGSKLRPA